MNGLSLLTALEDKQIKMMAQELRDKIHELIKEEKKYCWEKGIPTMMTPEKYNQINLLIDKCNTAWHVTALERLVTQSYVIPTFDEVDAYANDLIKDALT